MASLQCEMWRIKCMQRNFILSFFSFFVHSIHCIHIFNNFFFWKRRKTERKRRKLISAFSCRHHIFDFALVFSFPTTETILGFALPFNYFLFFYFGRCQFTSFFDGAHKLHTFIDSNQQQPTKNWHESKETCKKRSLMITFIVYWSVQ